MFELLKPGVVRLASRTGFPIIPLSFSAESVKIFRSWDRCMIPKPLTRGTIIYGEPIHVPSDLTDADVGKYMALVEAELNRITLDVDEKYGHVFR